MRVPVSTYRLQLNRDFPFSEARGLVGYLRDLGVGDLYCSPVLKARSGSVHCYDVVDHSVVNPELGGEEELDRLASLLSESGMGLLLDIVPNHMSAGPENRYWMDVLEYGRDSPYAYLFDIDWDPLPPPPKGKVLLPILERPLPEAVAEGKVRLAVGAGKWPLVVRAGNTDLPVSSAGYLALASSFEASGTLQPGDGLRLGLREVDGGSRRAFEEAKGRLARRLAADGGLRASLSRALARADGLLAETLRLQNYSLAHWKLADTKINYRRFLSVNELVALRVEDLRVFEATHRKILELLRTRRATGLRVDHADGLRDPGLYFRRLKSACGAGGVYVLAEKVLQTGKKLPPEWDVSGTTGYGFMNDLNGVFIRRENSARFDRIYKGFAMERASFAESVREGKLLAMEKMGSELRRLAALLSPANHSGGTARELKSAIREMAANFDGYRTYISPRTRSVRGSWRSRIIRAAAESRRRGAPPKALAAVEDALQLKRRGARKPESLEFVLRFQQFTAAVAVKGEEDTALYRYVRLTSANEVGGNPAKFGAPISEYHRRCRERARFWPHTMVSTSTHDTKRSEDVRARIDVLSEMPEAWEACLKKWGRLNSRARGVEMGRPVPSRNDEYLLYQTLLGAWPHPRGGRHADFVERMVAYMRKATKEERKRTDWAEPSAIYDRSLERFVRRILRRGRGNQFLEDFGTLQRAVDWYGMLNSLSQTLVKLTSPGVPDIYQGNELWDYSLVDPDNRRGVDFGLRKRMLAKIQRDVADRGERRAAREALGSIHSGMAKLYVTASVLRFRSANGKLFRDGGYTPMKASGQRRDNLCLFERRAGGSACIVCAPRFYTELCGTGELPLGPSPWGETRIRLPRGRADSYVDVLTGARIRTEAMEGRTYLRAAEVFSGFPVALLRAG
jgi:malto-oligosyltrehalose synthase